MVNMGILLWISRKFGDRLKTGDVFLIYLIIYPVGRFMLEFIRIEYSPIAGLNINQTVMAVIAVASSIALIIRHWKKTPKTGSIAVE